MTRGNAARPSETRNFVTPTGVALSYEQHGSGPPLVLVHGSFSDHRSNWFRTRPRLARHFTVYAFARRGRGDSAATEGHSVEDEAKDVAALIDHIGTPVHLLGHSHGAQVALAAAARRPRAGAKLILYEPPRPEGPQPIVLERMREAADRQDWLGVAKAFYEGVFELPRDIMQSLMAASDWQEVVDDARASLQDVMALSRYDFDAGRFAGLEIPVLLLTGSETPPEMFVTDALAEVLPDVRRAQFEGEGHEAMNTAPDRFLEAVVGFLEEETG
jgi:pimeloyl-ACP methyl ester carboxylesterase